MFSTEKHLFMFMSNITGIWMKPKAGLDPKILHQRQFGLSKQLTWSGVVELFGLLVLELTVE